MSTRSAPAIDRIVSTDTFPAYRIGEDPVAYYARVEQQALAMRAAGITHVRINDAVCSIPWTMDPENSYLRFTEYGYPMNQYVSSSYDRGIYYERLMEANRRILLANAALARKYGFRCYIMCVEPSFMQESFFRRHPDLRGPRVDNPACSTKPLFALCAMCPETQDHYAQLMRGMLRLVPEIDEIHIFTNDTGAGFCYSSHLYAGPNGPYHCKRTPPGTQAQTLCRVLLDAGTPINPHFRVVMTSGLAPSEKPDAFRDAPAGLTGSIYGAFAWGGGLEDYWGNMAIGPAVYGDPQARAAVRRWQHDDMAARVEPLRANGCPVYASYWPTYYRADDPRPYETHRIMCDYARLGVTNLIGGPPIGRWSANAAVIRDVIAHGPRDTDSVVRAIAARWVGEARADRLCQVWRQADRASGEQPMLAAGGHAIMLQPWITQMPIVPDESLLGPTDLDYFLTSVMRDQLAMREHQGGTWRYLHYSSDLLLAYIRQFDSVCLPAYDSALALLDAMLAEPALDADGRDCLQAQRSVLQQQQHGMRYLRLWLLAALHRLAHCTPPPGTPSLAAIIQQQIDLVDPDGTKTDDPRLSLMRRHRDDPVAPVDLSAFPTHTHPGTAGWEGAHEAPRH